MKYSDLISFNPIEDVIQLTTADDANRAKEYVKSYVMSDTMAANLKSPVLDQLQMDEVVDNKGVLVVGNYGTGKSHLMSVISSIAKDADNLQYLQNKNFAKEMECIAGKFEVLRIEIGGVTMSLREILFGFIEDDFAARGIDFEVPDFDTVRDNKKLIRDMMMAFSAKYPDKGYLIVVDEFLSYLTSRDERQIVLDLEFFRALGEMCSKSKLRVIFGVQEKIFDNPRFSFVSDTLKHVSDRFTQIVITKEATSYVVSERILKKTPEQKALIRKHLEKFSMLYTGMSSRMDEFVDLFPIHPSYIDVFNKIYLIENRHILKNISMTIRDIFNRDVPENEPGIISFDNYWPAIKSNGLLKSDVTINRVVTASGQLEDIINRAFPKPAYKPLAIKIIYALSVHRLTTNGLDVHFGLTAENLKDDLCLFMPMPEQDADFLLALIKTTLKDIMTTVSGQFIIYNDANNQYYIDVDKIVDYDEKIKQKASIMANGELNRYFYQLIYSCLDWDAKQYVPGFEIYQRDLNWDSHNIFREGYLFLGLPGERSTAQPERDFYIHIMPPYSSGNIAVKNLEDEVYFFFKSTAEFKEILGFFSAANAQAQISEGKDKDAGYATMTLRNGTVLSASNLDTVPRIGVLDLYEFKYLARPAQMAMAELKKLFDVLEINPALLDNPNDRDEGVKQLLKKAQETSNAAVLANQKLNNGFELWNEPLVDAQHLIAMQKACAAVKDEFSNYAARFNTPAKLNNFTLTFDEIDKLAEQIALIKTIAEYMTFKTDCANNVSYLSNIEFIDLGANFKQKLEAAKDEFRSARDSILTGTSGDAAAQKVNAALEKVKEEYIGIYFEEHKKKRLDIDDAKRRGKLQESSALANLRKLRCVEILSAAKLTKIEQDMANLKVCYELTPTELKTTHICPHCHYNLGDQVPNVAGQLDNLDIRIDDLVTEWTQTLLNTISDPIVASQKAVPHLPYTPDRLPG